MAESELKKLSLEEAVFLEKNGGGNFVPLGSDKKAGFITREGILYQKPTADAKAYEEVARKLHP